jgi:ferric-dicitrate binding protein FerR (iron transport regulator)
VPLSEHEQRALEALEHALHEQDPDFAHRVSSGDTLLNARRRRTVAVFGFVVGLILIVAFCMSTVVAVGVGGFIVMFASLNAIWTSTSQMRQAKLDGASRPESQARRRPWRRT